MKQFKDKQEYLAQRRKVAEAEKKTNPLLIASLCAFASLREIVYFFAASPPRDPNNQHPIEP